MNVLMVGMSRTWAEVLDNADERYHLYVVEEPDPWNNRKLGEVKLSNIREVQLEEYQQSDAALPVIAKFAEEVGADVVVPGLEYTVLLLRRLRPYSALPNLGEAAAKALTNKRFMRDRCVKVGIPIPRIPRVNNAEDVEWFFDGPLALKPANRQASTGVVRVERYEQIKWAWADAGAADESV